MEVFFVLLVLSLTRCSSGTFGTVTNFYPTETHRDGSIEFVIRMKKNSMDCSPGRWECFSGDCGNESSTVTRTLYQDDEGYCQVEQILTRRAATNGPFEIRSNAGEGGEDDISTANDRWRNLTEVDLRTRSDSGKSNTSPQLSMLPIVRVPVNCPMKLFLLRFDPDKDDVKCRFLSISNVECEACASAALLPSFSPFEPCTIVYTQDLSRVGDVFRVDQVIEDFPRTKLTLTFTNGSRETRSRSESLSKVLVQFLFKVARPVPSCEEGLYLPKFLPPTPDHEAQLFTATHQEISIVIRFAANYSSSSRLFHNGPINMTPSRSGLKEFELVWTPTDEQINQNFPVCVVLQVETMLGKHESEPRCFVVTVVRVPRFLNPTPPDGTELFVSVNQTVAVYIRVETSVAPPLELLFSGPGTMRDSTFGLETGWFVLFWVPSDSDEGQKFSISFSVTFSSMIFSQKPRYNYYQTELRTVTVTVRETVHPTTTPTETVRPTLTGSVFLRTKIISATPLSDDFLQNEALQKLRDELLNRGLTPRMTLRLVRRKLTTKETPPK